MNVSLFTVPSFLEHSKIYQNTCITFSFKFSRIHFSLKSIYSFITFTIFYLFSLTNILISFHHLFFILSHTFSNISHTKFFFYYHVKVRANLFLLFSNKNLSSTKAFEPKQINSSLQLSRKAAGFITF